MIPVNVVTGFLGSGKTTLLREVLTDPAFADSAVIVNEFGEIGLDHVLIEEVEEGVLLLESGCICCTIRSDLKETIRDLQDRAAKGIIPQFHRLIIETTGLADPAPIVSTIAAEPVIHRHFRIGNIVCTVDAVNGADQLDHQPESEKQASVADRLVITKCDIAQPKMVEDLERRLTRLNPTADITRTTGSGFDAERLFAEDVADAERRAAEVARWLNAVADPHEHAHSRHGDTTRAFCVVYPGEIDWTAFGIWLTALLHAHGDKVLRVKGILNVRESDTPVVIHGVQHIVHAPVHLSHWPDDSRTSRIVFIVRDIDEAVVRASLAAFMDVAGAGAPASDAA